MEPKHVRKADRHVRIPGKVIVDLNRIQRDSIPRAKDRKVVQIAAEKAGRKASREVSDQRLLEQADTKARHSAADAGERFGPDVDFRLNVPVTDDRPGDKLRIERYIHQKLEIGPLRRRFTAVNVDDIGDGLEGIERNPNWKRKRRNFQRQAENRIDGLIKQPAVFENAKQSEIDHNRTGHGEFRFDIAAVRLHHQPVEIIDGRGKNQEDDPDGLAPCVKKQRKGHQHDIPPEFVTGHIVENQIQREKAVKKN